MADGMQVIHRQEGLEVPIHNGIQAVQPGLYPHQPDAEDRRDESHPPGTHNEKWMNDPRGRSIYDIRRGRFVLILIFLLGILIVLALGLGLGLGLGLPAVRQASSSQSEPLASTPTIHESTSSPSAAASAHSRSETPTSSSVYSATSSQVAEVSGTPSTTCPGSNGTVYSASGFDFIIYCDHNVASGHKVDLSSGYQPTFDDCINLCAGEDYFQNRADVSAVYNFAGTGQQTPGTCWCEGGTASATTTPIPGRGNDLALIRSGGSSK